MYKLEVFIRLFNQTEDNLKEEINNKHFMFKTILRTKKDHRDSMNKRW